MSNYTLNGISLLIKHYYEQRQFKWPDAKDGGLFLATEVGEYLDALLRQEPDWTRNQEKLVDPAEELADCLMMVLVCAASLNITVDDVLIIKMDRKLKLIGLRGIHG